MRNLASSKAQSCEEDVEIEVNRGSRTNPRLLRQELEFAKRENMRLLRSEKEARELTDAGLERLKNVSDLNRQLELKSRQLEKSRSLDQEVRRRA